MTLEELRREIHGTELPVTADAYLACAENFAVGDRVVWAAKVPLDWDTRYITALSSFQSAYGEDLLGSVAMANSAFREGLTGTVMDTYSGDVDVQWDESVRITDDEGNSWDETGTISVPPFCLVKEKHLSRLNRGPVQPAAPRRRRIQLEGARAEEPALFSDLSLEAIRKVHVPWVAERFAHLNETRTERLAFLAAEVGEAINEGRKSAVPSREYRRELADIQLRLIALADSEGIDLAEAVSEKMAFNLASQPSPEKYAALSCQSPKTPPPSRS